MGLAFGTCFVVFRVGLVGTVLCQPGQYPLVFVHGTGGRADGGDIGGDGPQREGAVVVRKVALSGIGEVGGGCGAGDVGTGAGGEGVGGGPLGSGDVEFVGSCFCELVSLWLYGAKHELD